MSPYVDLLDPLQPHQVLLPLLGLLAVGGGLRIPDGLFCLLDLLVKQRDVRKILALDTILYTNQPKPS